MLLAAFYVFAIAAIILHYTGHLKRWNCEWILIVLAGPFVRAWFGAGFETSVTVAQMLIGAQLLVPLYLVGENAY